MELTFQGINNLQKLFYLLPSLSIEARAQGLAHARKARYQRHTFPVAEAVLTLPWTPFIETKLASV